MLIRLIMACHWHPANSTYQFAYQLFTLAILSLSPQLSRGSLYDVYKERLVLCNILHVMGNLAKIYPSSRINKNIREVWFIEKIYYMQNNPDVNRYCIKVLRIGALATVRKKLFYYGLLFWTIDQENLFVLSVW